jgi:lipopolysaccharide/colanic/teichoic acid biosynthesis glycosyltransferase
MHFSCSKTLAKASESGNQDPLPAWKRALDLLAVLASLPILALATLFMTLMIKLTSPGPVLFMQDRIGHKGRRFRIYKFRTMHTDSDTGIHQTHCEQLIRSNTPMVKMDARRDSRLIPGGWLLRASGLDELPQIINVWKGEMSLIGPRPCVPYEYEQYQPWQRERFDAVPGLTGLWQVSGKNRTTFDEMIRLDIHYAHYKTFWLDLKIILLTLPALLQQIGDTRSARKSAAVSLPPKGKKPEPLPESAPVSSV